MSMMRVVLPPLRVTLPAPSSTVSLLIFNGVVTVIVCGSGPQLKTIVPPDARAVVRAASLQLAGVPSPTVWSGEDVSTSWAGTSQVPAGGGGGGSSVSVVSVVSAVGPLVGSAVGFEVLSSVGVFEVSLGAALELSLVRVTASVGSLLGAAVVLCVVSALLDDESPHAVTTRSSSTATCTRVMAAG